MPTRNGNWIGNWQFQKQMDAVFEDDEGEHAAFSSILLVHVEIAAARGAGAMALLQFMVELIPGCTPGHRARRSLELGPRVMKRRHNPDTQSAILEMAGEMKAPGSCRILGVHGSREMPLPVIPSGKIHR